MSTQSKSFVRRLSTQVRKFIAPSLAELSRAGRIARTLWDAAQLQKKERRLYQQLGELTRSRVLENGPMPIEAERLIAKLEYNEHVLKRLDRLLKSYQMKSDSPVDLEEQINENESRHQPV
jgi:predicted kinase